MDESESHIPIGVPAASTGYPPYEGNIAEIEEREWPFGNGKQASGRLPISHWSHSSLMAYLRNPLAWYKRYVEHVYDTPSTPSSVVGRAAHVALQHFYSGIPKDGAVQLGLESLRAVSDFEINFGVATTRVARKKRRAGMEAEYLQAIHFYLARPPRHRVVDVEFKATARVPGLPLPIKAVSDLVVESRRKPGSLDIVDHKFVDSFSGYRQHKTLFILQAIFNYYTVMHSHNRPVERFLLYECKKTKNKDGSPQLRRYAIEYAACGEQFAIFKRLINDATAQMANTKVFLPNPSDMFEGENSFEIYRLGLQ